MALVKYLGRTSHAEFNTGVRFQIGASVVELFALELSVRVFMQISSFFTKWRINGEPEVLERRGFDVEVAGALLYLVVRRLLPWDENSGVHNRKRRDFVERSDFQRRLRSRKG